MSCSMQTNESDYIEQIKARVAALQQSHVGLQEQLEQTQSNLDRHINDSALRVIDILDMINTVQSKVAVNEENPHSTTPLIIKKIEKRLTDILRYWQVQEINVTEGRIEAGKTRVLETRKAADETSSGMILEICRKGYQRDDKIIRPADVITSC